MRKPFFHCLAPICLSDISDMPQNIDRCTHKRISATKDNDIFHIICDKLKYGRYMIIHAHYGGSTGGHVRWLEVKEVDIDIVDPRKFIQNEFRAFFNSVTNINNFSADTPPVRDCSELERLGITQNGYYYIDPSGTRQNANSILVYCDQGWTQVLKREYESDKEYIQANVSNKTSQ